MRKYSDLEFNDSPAPHLRRSCRWLDFNETFNWQQVHRWGIVYNCLLFRIDLLRDRFPAQASAWFLLFTIRTIAERKFLEKMGLERPWSWLRESNILRSRSVFLSFFFSWFFKVCVLFPSFSLLTYKFIAPSPQASGFARNWGGLKAEPIRNLRAIKPIEILPWRKLTQPLPGRSTYLFNNTQEVQADQALPKWE